MSEIKETFICVAKFRAVSFPDIAARALLCRKRFKSYISARFKSYISARFLRGADQYHFRQKSWKNGWQFSRVQRDRAPLTNRHLPPRSLVNDERRKTSYALTFRRVLSTRENRRERNKKKRGNEEDPSARAWHLRERPYRKDINA